MSLKKTNPTYICGRGYSVYEQVPWTQITQRDIEHYGLQKCAPPAMLKKPSSPVKPKKPSSPVKQKKPISPVKKSSKPILYKCGPRGGILKYVKGEYKPRAISTISKEIMKQYNLYHCKSEYKINKPVKTNKIIKKKIQSLPKQVKYIKPKSKSKSNSKPKMSKSKIFEAWATAYNELAQKQAELELSPNNPVLKQEKEKLLRQEQHLLSQLNSMS